IHSRSAVLLGLCPVLLQLLGLRLNLFSRITSQQFGEISDGLSRNPAVNCHLVLQKLAFELLLLRLESLSAVLKRNQLLLKLRHGLGRLAVLNPATRGLLTERLSLVLSPLGQLVVLVRAGLRRSGVLGSSVVALSGHNWPPGQRQPTRGFGS